MEGTMPSPPASSQQGVARPSMQELCARLKALASELEAAGGGAEGDDRRTALAQGALVLMELKSLNRAVCLNTDQARTLPEMSRDVTCLQHRKGVTACVAGCGRMLLPTLLVAGGALQGRVVLSHRVSLLQDLNGDWVGYGMLGRCASDMSGPGVCLGACLAHCVRLCEACRRSARRPRRGRRAWTRRSWRCRMSCTRRRTT